MNMTSVPNLIPVLPEIILALGAMAWLMLGVIKRDSDTTGVVSTLSIATLLGALVAVVMVTDGDQTVVTMNGMFIMDPFASFIKVLILVGAAATLMVARPFMTMHHLNRFEFPAMVLLATLGMLMMVSSNDFLSLYMGLELQSLSLYVLAAFSRDRARSTEAGLKYFVLGALSSGTLLYGISLIYGFSGNIEYSVVATLGEGDAPIGLVIGLVFVLAGLSFKISAVPFHMWTPDVYEGAPTPVSAFFAAAPKVAAFALLMRVLFDSFPSLGDEWRQIVILMSVLSMFIGAFVALMQTNLKRLMAYSSIGHVGYALLGVAAGTSEGVQGVLVYLAIYLTMSLGAFAVILNLRHKDGITEEIADLAGLMKTRPGLAICMGIFMFSLAGIPPMAGFMGKLYVFMAAVDAGLITLAVIGVVTSVVGAVYYLRIVKVMFMDDPKLDFVETDGRAASMVLTVSAVFNSPVFWIVASPILAWAGWAAASLVG